MPDVGLFTATEPVGSDLPVIIRYSVEVGGLQVYNESYDVETLASELKKDEAKALYQPAVALCRASPAPPRLQLSPHPLSR